MRACAVAALLALLSACASYSPSLSDGAPLVPITAAQVRDAKPRPDPVLAAGNTSPYEVAGKRYWVMPSAAGYRERGVASWYGRKFHGRKTANGEIFDAYSATAAHRSLPIPAYVRVTNLDNNRSMIVRVNDRGPFHPERIIDLSYGAAVKLGFADQGTTRVEVEAISVEGVADLRRSPGLAEWKSDYRYLQVGSFSRRDGAERLRQDLLSQLTARVEIVEHYQGGQALYRVRVGPVADRHQLLALQVELQGLGFLDVKAMPR